MLSLMNGGVWQKLSSTRRCRKSLVAHKKDEATYKRHLSTFNKAFLKKIYHSPYSSKLFNPT
jgi:hypothetical protein